MSTYSYIEPQDLRCEYLVAPQGLNDPHPRFSWAAEANGRNRRVSEYQLVVGKVAARVAAGEGDLWDTGRVDAPPVHLVRYDGTPLRPHCTLFWTVRLWDENGEASPYAPPERFDTGLLHSDAWPGCWISKPDFDPRIGRMAPTATPYDNPYQARPADYFRKSFPIDRGVSRARLYVTALGLFETCLNGEQLGDEVFAPGWTDYYKRVEYRLFDVAHLLQPGENVLGITAGEGWYSGRVANTLKRQGAHYGPKPAINCQLLVEYEDGRSVVVATDPTWSTSAGPIVYSDFLMGEKYDARLELRGWSARGYDAAAWWPVEETRPYPTAPRLEAPRAEPVRRTKELKAALLHRTVQGALVYDLGQNISGWVRLGLLNAVGDGQYVLRHAEALAENGELYTANLRSAACTDIFIAAAEGLATYEPRFTFHGFRYVEISGPDLDPNALTMTGILVNSDLREVGSFECGHPAVSRLQENILWSQRGNFLAVPTDCPQRDERLGWLADAQIFWPTASFNMDVSAFFTKWMRDIADTQFDDGAFTDVAPSKPHWAHRPHPAKGAPAWGDGAVIMMWEHYGFYGDADLVAEYWPNLLGWMDYIGRNNPNFIREKDTNNNYGDWLSLGATAPKALVATAYWARLAELMSRMARLVGDLDSEARFVTLERDVIGAFRERFVHADSRLEGDTQTGYLLALDFNLLDDATAKLAKSHLLRVLAEADDHLATGFLGVRHLCPVLSDIGRTDLAYKLLLNEDYPSWLFPVLNGATTIWERWDGWTPDRGFQTSNMNSLNHYAYGAIGEWLFRRVAGIDFDSDRPGFSRVVCRPLPDRRLGWVRSHYRCHRGTIAVHWAVDAEWARYSVSLPPDTMGLVELPIAKAAGVRLDGKALDQGKDIGAVVERDGIVAVEIGSGEWLFEWIVGSPGDGGSGPPEEHLRNFRPAIEASVTAPVKASLSSNRGL